MSPGYFETMGIPLRGRDFTPGDRVDTLRVTIISESMAEMYWPGDDPIGKTVVIGSFGEEPHTIIGVAGNVRSFGLDADPAPMVYGSAVAYAGWNPMSLVWRAAAAGGQPGPASPTAAGARNPRRRPSYRPGGADLRRAVAQRHVGGFVWASSLQHVPAGRVCERRADAGCHRPLRRDGLLVAQRTREIGVRLALGAERRDIFRLILGRGVVLWRSIGAGIGVGVALWLSTRDAKPVVLGVCDRPGTFAAVPILLILVAAFACYVPARRAMSVDPVTALRAE